jgi:hypothetical protein
VGYSVGQIYIQKRELDFHPGSLYFLGVPKGMDRYVPNIENIILFCKTEFVNIRKNICKDSGLGGIVLDGIG